jgi:hypothetical protein
MPDERRALLLLSVFPQAERRHVEAELSGGLAPVVYRAYEAGARVRTGVQIDDDPLMAVAAATGREATPVAAIVEITAPPGTSDDQLLRAIDGVGHRFGGVIDWLKSTVVVGSVRKITSGPTGPTMLALGTRRLSRLTQKEFADYWAGVHAPLALSLMPPGAAERIGYQQLHGDEEATRRAVEAAGLGSGELDGVLQVLCVRPEDFLAVAAEPSFAKEIADDEKNFAEQTGMRGGFVRLAD